MALTFETLFVQGPPDSMSVIFDVTLQTATTLKSELVNISLTILTQYLYYNPLALPKSHIERAITVMLLNLPTQQDFWFWGGRSFVGYEGGCEVGRETYCWV